MVEAALHARFRRLPLGGDTRTFRNRAADARAFDRFVRFALGVDPAKIATRSPLTLALLVVAAEDDPALRGDLARLTAAGERIRKRLGLRAARFAPFRFSGG